MINGDWRWCDHRGRRKRGWNSVDGGRLSVDWRRIRRLELQIRSRQQPAKAAELRPTANNVAEATRIAR